MTLHHKPLLVFIALMWHGNGLTQPTICNEDTRILDARIKTIDYDIGKTYKIQGAVKQSTIVAFDTNEHIAWVDCGGHCTAQKAPAPQTQASSAQQVQALPDLIVATPNQRTRLVIRPQVPAKKASITVETSRGRFYTFDLTVSKHTAHNNPNNVWRAHFCYPEQERKRRAKRDAIRIERERKQQQKMARKAKKLYYAKHVFSWDKTSPLAPKQIFHDGTFTHFVYEGATPTVGIYRVDVDGYDVSTRSHIENNSTVVVHSLADRFTIRRSGQTLCVKNTTVSSKTVATHKGGQGHGLEFNDG